MDGVTEPFVHESKSATVNPLLEPKPVAVHAPEVTVVKGVIVQ